MKLPAFDMFWQWVWWSNRWQLWRSAGVEWVALVVLVEQGLVAQVAGAWDWRVLGGPECPECQECLACLGCQGWIWTCRGCQGCQGCRECLACQECQECRQEVRKCPGAMGWIYICQECQGCQGCPACQGLAWMWACLGCVALGSVVWVWVALMAWALASMAMVCNLSAGGWPVGGATAALVLRPQTSAEPKLVLNHLGLLVVPVVPHKAVAEVSKIGNL